MRRRGRTPLREQLKRSLEKWDIVVEVDTFCKKHKPSKKRRELMAKLLESGLAENLKEAHLLSRKLMP